MKEKREAEIKTYVLAKDKAEAFMPLLAPGWHEFTEEDDKILIGAEAEGKAVGVLLLAISEEKRHCELEYLFVSEKYRRRKVGTALLNRALRVCRQFEADSLKCMVVGEEGSGMDGLLKSWGMEC
nr:GNAT family N-acetyltransferase [Lachnospiraceae bacterium]